MRHPTHYTQIFIGGYHHEKIFLSSHDCVDVLRDSVCRLRWRGGGSDTADPEQTESLTDDTGDYDFNEEGRGNSDSSISVRISPASAWIPMKMCFYAQKKDGHWDTLADYDLLSAGSNLWGDKTDKMKSVKDLTAASSYVAFGFEVDVFGNATYWPYSGVFWTAEDTAEKGTPSKIDIDIGGTAINVSISIKVDDNEVYSDGNCSSHIRYGWNGITVEFQKTDAYSCNAVAFYGRKSNSRLWVKLLEANGSSAFEHSSEVTQYIYSIMGSKAKLKTKESNIFNIPKDYVEFGFEFDINGGISWPYSNVFWTPEDSAKTPVHTILIYAGGAFLTPSITFEVNGEQIYYESNLTAKRRYYFNTSNQICVRTWKTWQYVNNYTRVYARKDATSKWDVVLDKNEGESEIFIDDDYVEFGFEFDIWGGSKWPYSDVFWTADDSAKETVDYIWIEMTGGAITSNIDIYVNNVNRVSKTNLSSKKEEERYPWDISAIKVIISHSGTFTRDEQELYAYKPNGEKVVLSKSTGSYTMLVPASYTVGYKVHFWSVFGSYGRTFNHPDDRVEEITIHSRGWAIFGSPYIDYEVKGRKYGKGDTVTLYTHTES